MRESPGREQRCQIEEYVREPVQVPHERVWGLVQDAKWARCACLVDEAPRVARREHRGQLHDVIDAGECRVDARKLDCHMCPETLLRAHRVMQGNYSDQE